MPKPLDATLNALIDARPGDWADYLAARLGLPTGPADVLDTDLSTTLQADRLFRINAPTPFVIHLELEASAALGTPERLLRYNVNAWAVAALPVHSVVVLLRPKANASDLTGTLTRPGATGTRFTPSATMSCDFGSNQSRRCSPHSAWPRCRC